MNISRRKFLTVSTATAGTLTLQEYFSKYAWAATPRVRHDASSTEGQRMLLLYRRAIADMQKLPHYDPLSWRFQANIHWIPRDEPIDRIFDPGQGSTEEERRLILRYKELALGSDGDPRTNFGTATGAWMTCPHHRVEFAPWHRFYLHFLERIVESFAGETFSLPYWNYVNADQRALPLQFREAIDGSQQNNALFFAQRNPGFNDVDSPTGVDNADVRIRDAFGEKTLLPPPGRGFSRMLEASPHDNVHGAVGPVEGMGSIRFAARDPIFYLHHGEIDRLWESWRYNGGGEVQPERDPSDKDWLDRKFAFVTPEREKVVMTTVDALKMMENLGYEYDTLQQPPAILIASAGAVRMTVSDESQQQRVVARAPDDGLTTTVTDQAVEIRLNQVAPAITDETLDAGVARRYVLVLDEIAPAEETAARYDVYVNMPAGAQATDKSSFLAGRFSLFGVGVGVNVAGHTMTSIPRAFDVTELVTSDVIDLSKLEGVTVTIAPVDGGSEKVVPITIAGIRIVVE